MGATLAIYAIYTLATAGTIISIMLIYATITEKSRRTA